MSIGSASRCTPAPICASTTTCRRSGRSIPARRRPAGSRSASRCARFTAPAIAGSTPTGRSPASALRSASITCRDRRCRRATRTAAKRFNWSAPQPCSPEPPPASPRAAPPSLTGSQLAGSLHRDLGGKTAARHPARAVESRDPDLDSHAGAARRSRQSKLVPRDKGLQDYPRLVERRPEIAGGRAGQRRRNHRLPGTGRSARRSSASVSCVGYLDGSVRHDAQFDAPWSAAGLDPERDAERFRARKLRERSEQFGGVVIHRDRREKQAVFVPGQMHIAERHLRGGRRSSAPARPPSASPPASASSARCQARGRTRSRSSPGSGGDRRGPCPSAPAGCWPARRELACSRGGRRYRRDRNCSPRRRRARRSARRRTGTSGRRSRSAPRPRSCAARPAPRARSCCVATVIRWPVRLRLLLIRAARRLARRRRCGSDCPSGSPPRRRTIR